MDLNQNPVGWHSGPGAPFGPQARTKFPCASKSSSHVHYAVEAHQTYLESLLMLSHRQSSKKCLTGPPSTSDKAFIAITDEIKCIFS